MFFLLKYTNRTSDVTYAMNVDEARTKTYYEILGVPLDASPQQIREMYKDLAKLYHPDSNYYADLIQQAPSAEQVELFKIITTAYQTLIDPDKRGVYDDSVRPLLTGSFKKWEESEEDFFKEKKSSRTRKHTFGTGMNNEVLEANVIKKGPANGLTQVVKIKRKKLRKSKVAILLVLICIVAITGALLFFLHK